MKIVLCTLISCILLGCTAYSEQAQLAQKNEWYEVGVMDGKAGGYQRVKFELNELNTLDDVAYKKYRQGYITGVEAFCQPENSYERGERGVRYQGQCANTSQEDVAVQKWQEGYESYMLETLLVYIDDYPDFF